MKEAAAKARLECEVVIITAGSSASTRDMTAEVIRWLGEPGVLVHGINTRPGKPTILGVCNGKAVIGLPGNPVSSAICFEMFARPLLATMLGRRRVHRPLRPNAVRSGVVVEQVRRHRNNRQMRRRSPFLRELWPVERCCPEARIVTIAAELAAIVYPRESCHLANAENVDHPGVGHAGLLVHRRSVAAVLSALFEERAG